MGTFTVGCRVTNIIDRSESVQIDRLLVDTGSEYTWIAGELLEQIGVSREKKDLQFVMANGTVITRSVGSRSSMSRIPSRLTKSFSPNQATCSSSAPVPSKASI